MKCISKNTFLRNKKHFFLLRLNHIQRYFREINAIQKYAYHVSPSHSFSAFLLLLLLLHCSGLFLKLACSVSQVLLLLGVKQLVMFLFFKMLCIKASAKWEHNLAKTNQILKHLHIRCIFTVLPPSELKDKLLGFIG